MLDAHQTYFKSIELICFCWAETHSTQRDSNSKYGIYRINATAPILMFANNVLPSLIRDKNGEKIQRVYGICYEPCICMIFSISVYSVLKRIKWWYARQRSMSYLKNTAEFMWIMWLIVNVTYKKSLRIHFFVRLLFLLLLLAEWLNWLGAKGTFVVILSFAIRICWFATRISINQHHYCCHFLWQYSRTFVSIPDTVTFVTYTSRLIGNDSILFSATKNIIIWREKKKKTIQNPQIQLKDRRNLQIFLIRPMCKYYLDQWQQSVYFEFCPSKT